MSTGLESRGDRTLFYEDLRYGMVLAGGPRTIGERELELFAEVSGDRNPLHVDRDYAAETRFGQRVVHGPLGIAVTMGMLHELGVLERSALALLDVEWRFLAPTFVGDELSMEMTITGRRLARKGEAGVVGRHVRLRNQDGVAVQEGTMGLLVRVGDPERARAEDEERPAPGTPAWGRRLGDALEGDEEFAAAARAFDGAIGLRFGAAELALKVFEGRVLKVARRLAAGTTFSVGAPEIAWLDFLQRERNEFMAMTTRGAFAVSGDVHEYLRLTRALSALLDRARELPR